MRTKGLKEISLKCVILKSKARYVGAPGGASTYETELSASTGHVRNALELCNHVATRVDSGHGFCGLLLAPKPSGRLLNQARRFCSCRFGEISHLPATSLAPRRPRRAQDSERADKRRFRERRQEMHERPFVYYMNEIAFNLY